MVQIIKVIVDLVDNFTKNSKKIETNINGMGKKAQTLTKYSEQLGRSTADLERGLSMQGLAFNKNGRLISKLTGRFVGLKQSMMKARDMTSQFRMELLGTMFFGMMVASTFMAISKAGTDAFMKITEGQTQAGQALTRLQGGFTYLQYVVGDAIGSALLPHMDAIISIVEALADWIDQNQGLTAGLITAGIVIGGALFLIGSFGLGISSVSQLIGKAGTAAGGGGLVGRLAGLELGLVGVGIALVVLQGLWNANWANIQETFSTKQTLILDGLMTINDMFQQVFEYNWADVMWSFKRLGIDALTFVVNKAAAFLNQMIAMMNFVGSFAGFEIPLITGVDSYRDSLLKMLGPKPSSIKEFAGGDYTISGTDAAKLGLLGTGGNGGNVTTTETGDVMEPGAVKIETQNNTIIMSPSELAAGQTEYMSTVDATFTSYLSNSTLSTGGVL